MVEVYVSRLGLDSTTNSFVVILQERSGARIVPIWIGRTEAESIAAHLNGVLRERPMTHDLARALVVALGGELRAVHVTRVEDATYFAEMHLERDGERLVVDARPSDSIAIALRFEAPIFAAEDLLAEYEQSGDADETGAEEGTASDAEAEFGDAGFLDDSPSLGIVDRERESAEQLKRHLERLRPEDFGKFTP